MTEFYDQLTPDDHNDETSGQNLEYLKVNLFKVVCFKASVNLCVHLFTLFLLMSERSHLLQSLQTSTLLNLTHWTFEQNKYLYFCDSNLQVISQQSLNDVSFVDGSVRLHVCHRALIR